MAYDEALAGRVRKVLSTRKDVEEKKMMGGLTFMVNGKMCVGIFRDKLMARIGAEAYDAALKRPGCTKMEFTGRALKGFVFVSPAGTESGTDLKSWIDLALRYNADAPSSRKKGTPPGRTAKKSGQKIRR